MMSSASQPNQQNDTPSVFERIAQVVINEDKMHVVGTRISDGSFRVPRFEDYRMMIVHNYTLTQLKTIARAHKQKLTGNKSHLIVRIFEYLYYSIYARVIQRVVRGRIATNYIKSKGPAFSKRTDCLNECDLLTMDELTKINPVQFFSFKDTTGFNYGFDAVSMYNLIHKSLQNQERMTDCVVKNPYTNEPLPANAIGAFNAMMRLSKILKLPVYVNMDGEPKPPTTVSAPQQQHRHQQQRQLQQQQQLQQHVQARVRNIFHAIDDLGNFTNTQWFLSLNATALGVLYRELLDIWVYRANLSMNVKRNICPPVGNPFEGQVRPNALQGMRLNDARTIMASIMEKFIGGVDLDSRCIGAYYVLGALTLVNMDVADALPWLYQAMVYN